MVWRRGWFIGGRKELERPRHGAQGWSCLSHVFSGNGMVVRRSSFSWMNSVYRLRWLLDKSGFERIVTYGRGIMITPFTSDFPPTHMDIVFCVVSAHTRVIDDDI